MVKNNILEVIGNTPLVRLDRIKKDYDLSFNLFAKLERLNPSGSVKDRAALKMFEDAIRDGKINKDTEIIEATSGNTGISLAMISAYYGLKCNIYMPENASKERILMMKAYGANVILTKKELGMKGSVDEAIKRHSLVKNSFILDQFNNKSNVFAHYETTAKEIFDDLEGKIDVIVAGFGTGGTISGISKFFKEKQIKVEIIGVEPKSSPLINENKSGPHLIQGIGANFIPKNLDLDGINEVIDISNEESYFGAKLLAKKEGILAGVSSGAALMASLKLDKNKYKNKNVVIILPDNGERYLTVEGLYE